MNHLRKAEEILKFGYPPSDIIILYEGFVVCYDTNKNISKWTAYHLTPADLDGNFCNLSAVNATVICCFIFTVGTQTVNNISDGICHNCQL